MKSGRRPTTRARDAVRLSAGILGLVGTQMVVLVDGAHGAAAAPPSVLAIHQQIGQALVGSPLTVTVVVTAPADRTAAGLVVTETLPGCSTLVPNSILPTSLAVASVDPANGGTSCDAGSTLVFGDLGDLAPGASAQFTFAVLAAAALGTPLTLEAQASATDNAGRRVPTDASGIPLEPKEAWLEVAHDTGTTAVTAFGITDTFSPVTANESDGAVTDAVSVSEAAGYAPTVVGVDAYFPAGTASGCPEVAPPHAECHLPTSDSVVLVPNAADPAVPVVPIATPALHLPAGLLQQPAAQAGFTHLHWDVAVAPAQPTTFSLGLRLPDSLGDNAFEDLLLVGGNVTTSSPLVPAGYGSSPPPQTTFSQGSRIDHVTWPTAAAPVAPPTIPTITSPSTDATSIIIRRPALSAAVVSGPLSSDAPASLAQSVSKESTPSAPTGRRVLTASAAARNPFLDPASARESVTAAPTPAATSQLPALAVSAAPAVALAHTGADVASEIVDGLLLILGGGTAAAVASRRRAPLRRGAHFQKR